MQAKKFTLTLFAVRQLIMKILRTKEIEKLTDLSRKTLNRYVHAGWLQAPEFKSFGRYGASNFWPENTVKQLSTIKSLKQTGHKNKEIDQILKKGVK